MEDYGAGVARDVNVGLNTRRYFSDKAVYRFDMAGQGEGATVIVDI
jgi:hypothetical protein